MRPSRLATTSVLVPTSTSIARPLCAAMSIATRSAAVSAPTWLAISGRPYTRACGWMIRPSWRGRLDSAVVVRSPARNWCSICDL